jgi:hypothetical protein
MSINEMANTTEQMKRKMVGRQEWKEKNLKSPPRLYAAR